MGRFLLLSVGMHIGLWAQVVINELQPVPPTGEPEWVELFNRSDTAVDLSGFYIYDRTSRASLAGVQIRPRGFAILTRDTDDLKLLRRIPPIARLYQVALPTLNNTTENVFLATRDTLVMDSVYYDMRWGIRGRTLERIDPFQPGHVRENIGVCIAPDSATCGYDNSLSLVERDAQLRSVAVDSAQVIRIELVNRGRTAFERISIRLQARHGRNPSWSELGQWVAEYLPPSATSNLAIPLTELAGTVALRPGQYVLRAFLENTDERAWNDTASTSMFLPFLPGSIGINEIMFDPTDGKSEYVELVNRSGDTVELGDLLLGDGIPPQSSLPAVSLAAGEYAVVALDTGIWNTFPEIRGDPRGIILKASWTLSNSGDVIRLANPDGRIIDSVHYLPSWHFWGLRITKGRALEKLQPSLPSDDPRSWSSSTDPRGGTPAKPNSILASAERDTRLSASPNPFSPTSTDARLQQTTITYRLPWQSARITLRIFDASGIPIRELANGQYSAAEGALLWDGRNNAGFAVGAGAYVLLLEASDALSRESIREQLVIVIGN
ncbi:MAG: hypothetical protein KatS3mg039_1033 [Candidatus Kapaibacterium sp.]|nr:MAG: hypothetical protein KatS3mg039_1033 [Candidatus Kapabacteria bacterium]